MLTDADLVPTTRWRTLYMFQHACSESCLREIAAQMDEEAMQE